MKKKSDKKIPLMKNLAPKGYHAELAKNSPNTLICSGCAFENYRGEDECGGNSPCCADDREDGLYVIFVANKKDK